MYFKKTVRSFLLLKDLKYGIIIENEVLKMNQNTANSNEVLDDYFGSLSFIKHNDNLIKKLATDFFGRSVEIDFFSVSPIKEHVEKKGFIRIDGFRIPFRYIQAKKSKFSKVIAMEIALYYSVVYSRDQHFKNDDYHHINTLVKNVLKEKADDYTKKLLTFLPSHYAVELAGVLESIYFYPHIDNKNGKSMKMSIDLARNNTSYFISHYQSTSKLFNSNMSFFYDGEILSLTSQQFSTINTKNLDFQDYWKNLLASYFSKPCLQDLISHRYATMNELLFDLAKGLEVIEMNEI